MVKFRIVASKKDMVMSPSAPGTGAAVPLKKGDLVRITDRPDLGICKVVDIKNSEIQVGLLDVDLNLVGWYTWYWYTQLEIVK